MRFVVVGCSIHTAPLSMREKLAFGADEIPDAIQKLSSCDDIEEVMLVSTCNRVEIYAVGNDASSIELACRRFLRESRNVDKDELDKVIFRYSDADALAHIFRVTASLDALVVGEAQIMGQVKDAFAISRKAGGVSALLGRCLERAFFTAKRVRTETDIARHPASVSSVAVDLAGRVFEDLSSVAVLIIGAGEMAELAGTHLRGHGTSRIRVANRSLERGESLASTLSGKAVPFETLSEQLKWADVVISSTGSPKPILDKPMITKVLKERKQRPLLIVDIAVPRDVEPDVRKIDNVYLFDVDALEQVVGQNLKKRREEAKAAEKMVANEVKAFEKWLHTQRSVPLIKAMRYHFREQAHQETKKTIKKLRLKGDEAAAVKKLGEAIVAKLLHSPMIELKKKENIRNPHLAKAVIQLFDIDDETIEKANQKRSTQQIEVDTLEEKSDQS